MISPGAPDPFFFFGTSSLTARRAREKNWSRHLLGEPSAWPSALKHALALLYTNPAPTAVFWGGEQRCFYNDALWNLLDESCRAQDPGEPAPLICGALWSELASDVNGVLKEGSARHQRAMSWPSRPQAYFESWHLPVQNADGHTAGVLSTWTDVSEKISIERRLRQSEDQYRAITELSPQFVWMADAHGGITYTNQSHLDFFGLQQEQLTGDKWLDLVHPDDRARTARVWRESAETGLRFNTEFRVRRADGEYRWLLSLGRPLLDNERKTTGWLGVSFDIHDRKLVEQELQRAKEDAERANQLKSTFLANMSHEIRTPLGAMLGFADVLKDPELTTEDRGHYLDILTRNGEQLSSIINDILDLSKVEAGFLNFERRETHPLQIAFDTVSLLGVKAQEKRIALEVHTFPGVPDVIVSDPVRLKQILLNIVGNAVKFTSAGGVRILLSGCSGPQGRPGVRFEVKDTGIGLAPDAAADLFQLFHQADTSTSRKFGGTGLGLALSRRLARGLGGDVMLLESRLGQGSTFMIEVQSFADDICVAKAQPEKASEPRLDDKPLLGKRVLVVEDSADNQKLIQHLLIRRGAHVDLAGDGEQGVRMALNGRYNVVLMDIQMPVMDGYAATRRLRELGYPGAIIALTAHAMNEVRMRALGVGYTDHLPKPIHAPDLIAAVLKYSAVPPLSPASSGVSLDHGI